MPLVMMVGMPGSGKSSRAKQLKEELCNNFNRSAIIVSDNDIMKSRNIDKNVVYSDVQKEKELRGILMSETLRVLSRDNVVIMDASNYIKGFRYEVYCGSKSFRSTQCVIEVVAPVGESYQWNENTPCPYTEEVWTALRTRYEPPDPSRRWDSPLFVVPSDRPLPISDIHEALFSSKPPPPNASTQNAPLSQPDLLHILDTVTQDVVKEVLSGCRQLESGTHSAAALNRIKRQFINYTKLHPPSSSETSPQSKVWFLLLAVGLFVTICSADESKESDSDSSQAHDGHGHHHKEPAAEAAAEHAPEQAAAPV